MASMSDIVTALRAEIEAVDVSAHAQGTSLTSLALTEAVSGDDGSWLGVDHLAYMIVFAGELLEERQRTGAGHGRVQLELHMLYRIRAGSSAADRLADQLDGWALARAVTRAALDAEIDGDVGCVASGTCAHLGAVFGPSSDIHVWRIPLTITCEFWS